MKRIFRFNPHKSLIDEIISTKDMLSKNKKDNNLKKIRAQKFLCLPGTPDTKRKKISNASVD